jgi:hypothetical protein
LRRKFNLLLRICRGGNGRDALLYFAFSDQQRLLAFQTPLPTLIVFVAFAFLAAFGAMTHD